MRDMKTAPLDGRMVRLWFVLTDDTTSLEDQAKGEVAQTIGYFQEGQDDWIVVGWDWCQDQYLTHEIKQPIGWEPLFDDDRLQRIAKIIEHVDTRCLAADGPVTPTLKEIQEIYDIASGKRP